MTLVTAASKISLKGLGAGLLAALVMSIPTAYLEGYYFIELYNYIAPGIKISSEAEASKFGYQLLFHPLAIAQTVMSMVLSVGIPAYITAFVAGKEYILNSLCFAFLVYTMAIVYLLVSGIYKFLVDFPLYAIAWTATFLLIAYLAGRFRERHERKIRNEI